jgi:hypothetical protein
LLGTSTGREILQEADRSQRRAQKQVLFGVARKEIASKNLAKKKYIPVLLHKLRSK